MLVFVANGIEASELQAAEAPVFGKRVSTPTILKWLS